MIIDRLPTTVTVGGREVNVSYGFRALVLIELCIFDENRSEEQRVLDVLNLFYCKNIPEPADEAMERLLWFYRCGEERDTWKKTGRRVKNVRVYDFEQDAPYIFAAFLSQYNTDLSDISSNELHWWKFRAMFDSLDERHRIKKIMEYRGADISRLKGKQKEFYSKMKKVYALKCTETADARLALEERNRRMKEYVRRRFEEEYGEGK